jgi:hypothetical protein
LRSAAEWEGRRWSFEHHGLAHPSVTVRREGSEEPVALLTTSAAGARIVRFSSGRRYRWTREHLWTAGWCFRREDEPSPVSVVSQEPGPFMPGGKVHVCCAAADSPDAPVLVLLAWFLRLLEFDLLSESIFICA